MTDFFTDDFDDLDEDNGHAEGTDSRISLIHKTLDMCETLIAEVLTENTLSAGQQKLAEIRNLIDDNTRPATTPENITEEIHHVADTLKSFEIFTDLSEDHLLLLASLIKEVRLEVGTAFIRQYEEVDGVYILFEDVTVSEMNRFIPDETRSGILGALCCLTDESEAPYTATTIKACSSWFIARKDFIRVVKGVPEILEKLSIALTRRLKNELITSKQLKTHILEQQRLTEEILEHMGVGSLSVNHAGEIGHNYNKLAEKYLGKTELAGMPFADIILRDNREGLRNYYRALQLLFSGNQIDPEVIVSLLPKVVSVNDRVLKLDYSFVEDKYGNTLSLFIKLEDITLSQTLEKKEIQEKKIVDAMRSNLGGYLSMLEEMEEVLGRIEHVIKQFAEDGLQPDEGLQGNIMRMLHSLKGLCGQFELDALKKIIHRTEDVIQQIGLGHGADDPFKDIIDTFKKEFKVAVSFKDTLGDEIIAILKGISFSETEFALLQESADRGDMAAIKTILHQKTLLPAARITDNWKKDIEKLAAEKGKPVEFLTDIPDNLYIPESLVRKLNMELGHIYRNGIDHGIEPPEEREKKGKKKTGTISLSAGNENGCLKIEIRDDGAGIDEEKIIELALRNNRLDQKTVQRYIDSNEAWRILFLPGFSSNKKITTMSGRGVGLDSVITALEAMGGTIELASQKDVGSAFIIRLDQSTGKQC